MRNILPYLTTFRSPSPHRCSITKFSNSSDPENVKNSLFIDKINKKFKVQVTVIDDKPNPNLHIPSTATAGQRQQEVQRNGLHAMQWLCPLSARVFVGREPGGSH